MTNPFEPPETPSSPVRPAARVTSPAMLAGVVCAGLIAIYGMVLIASLYEMMHSTLPVTDYVRHAVASAVFVMISAFTMVMIRRGGRHWIPWFLLSCSLVAVFFYPGLGTVVRVCIRILSGGF